MEEYRSAELQREFEQARNFEWFVANYALFQRTYGDSVLVIENCRIVGVYNGNNAHFKKCAEGVYNVLLSCFV